MKQSYYLMVFAIWCATPRAHCQELPPPYPPPQMPPISLYQNLEPLKRLARQMPPPPVPPEMPPMPPMPSKMTLMQSEVENLDRKRRSAKGVGGSMPTRKG